ncbi:hypothetical protein GUJ93_ZPchr0011g28842 [Zizania palustris]|uniref:BAG domain-containing protein n=1 Tax=Zizania palustris TaxID=103762 RepID=A0A8J5WKR7_ZIZPA|nr:hypothetical protein GUJ93_ZPchr0011g28842 [Zizania palustris]
MASRRFFGYDPYSRYYPAAAPPPARHAAGFFPVGAEYPEPVVRADVRPRPRSSRSVSVPVRFVGSDSALEMEVERGERRGERRTPSVVGRMADAVPRKRSPTVEEAAVRVQAAARGFLARRMVREVRAVEAEAGDVARKVVVEGEALRGDARGRIAVGEALMRLLLRLDAVHGARLYRRRVTKRVIALQDALDALEPKTTAPVEAAPEVADDAPAAIDMGEAHESEVEVPTSEAGTEMEVDGGRATGGEAEPDKAAAEPDKTEEIEEAEGEWETVTAEAWEDSPAPEARYQEQVGEEDEKQVVAAERLDTRTVMDMVAALCERSAQQCAVIGALAERVDALERAVRRVEEVDRRRRRKRCVRSSNSD